VGSLIIVDDADHLQPEQLHWLTRTAAATNTKLVLITTADGREPAHTLLTVLADMHAHHRWSPPGMKCSDSRATPGEPGITAAGWSI
jgi:hypothetical protein